MITHPQDPIRLRSGLEVANRFVLAPMTTYSSRPDGVISDDELPYLERRSAGGFGLVMTAACCVHRTGWAFQGQWLCWSDDFMPSLRSAADAIHRGGNRAVLQIHHGGRQCPPEKVGGQCVSASAVPSERPNAPIPRALEPDEILDIIASFASSAVRAKAAGFDGVEIHGANTYLIQQFVSPHSNRRTDEWGQDRLKFPLAVTDAVLDAVGPSFSVGYRFSPEEPETPGIRIADTEALLHALAERPLDYLHVSLRNYNQSSLHGEYPESTLARVVHTVAGRTPVIGVGSVKSLADAQAVLDVGAAMVAVGRVAISDPEFPRNAVAGEPVRTKVPLGNFAETLTLPKGLADKIEAVPGWFEREEPN